MKISIHHVAFVSLVLSGLTVTIRGVLADIPQASPAAGEKQ